jgi:hypothetical protein
MKPIKKGPTKLIFFGEYRGLPVYIAGRTSDYAKARFYCLKKARYYVLDLKEILEVKVNW